MPSFHLPDIRLITTKIMKIKNRGKNHGRAFELAQLRDLPVGQILSFDISLFKISIFTPVVRTTMLTLEKRIYKNHGVG